MMAAPVKIVVINTQYVETDETSFKSVVQELTGKDAHAHSGVVSKERESLQVHHDHDDHHHHQSPVDFRDSILMRDLSFKEFERLAKEIPFMDELHGLWAN